jgi:hypothetical protein
MISLQDKKPEVASYEAYRRGKAAGQVSGDVARLSFFVNNQMKEYVLQLGEKNYVRLTNSANEISFE